MGCIMNLQDVITRRASLTYIQELSLIECLTYKCAAKRKDLLKQVVKNKFYSAFNGKSFAKQFILTDLECSFRPKSELDRSKELELIRKELLKCLL